MAGARDNVEFAEGCAVGGVMKSVASASSSAKSDSAGVSPGKARRVPSVMVDSDVIEPAVSLSHCSARIVAVVSPDP